jgi:uncharacterized protein YbaP (TraB family)
MDKIMKTTKHFAFFLIILFLLFFNSCSTIKNPYFWKASINGSTVYFYGAIHTMTDEMAKKHSPRNQDIYNAFNSAAKIFFEADNEQNESTDKALFSQVIYKLPKSLALTMPVDEITRLSEFFEEHAFKFEKKYLMITRPFWIYFQLLVGVDRRLGGNYENGIDRHFLKKVSSKEKILYLEDGLESQKYFDEKTDSLYSNALINVMNLGIKDFHNDLNKEWELYFDGRFSESKSYFESKASEGEKKVLNLYYKWLIERNSIWAENILKNIKPGKTYFVVGGTSHFLDSGNVFEKLKKRSKSFKLINYK